jgi:hypothetical protein
MIMHQFIHHEGHEPHRSRCSCELAFAASFRVNGQAHGSKEVPQTPVCGYERAPFVNFVLLAVESARPPRSGEWAAGLDGEPVGPTRPAEARYFAQRPKWQRDPGRSMRAEGNRRKNAQEAQKEAHVCASYASSRLPGTRWPQRSEP